MASKEVEVRELLQKASQEVRGIVEQAIDLEYAKIHMNNPKGIKEEITQLVRGVIK